MRYLRPSTPKFAMAYPFEEPEPATISSRRLSYQGPTFKFLNLLPEIRIMIYNDLLIQQDTIGFCSCTICSPAKTHVRLLETCKTIHKEATPILYSKNTFLFETKHGIQARDSLDTFLGRIRDSVEYLTSVRLSYFANTTHLEDGLDILQFIPSLRRVELQYFTWQVYKPDALAEVLGPLVIAMHRVQREEADRRPRDVLRGLMLSSVRLRAEDGCWKCPVKLRGLQERYDGEAREFEKEVKGLLRKMLE